jgi:hypothetical protein
MPDRLARSVGPGERGTEIVVGERHPRRMASAVL